MENVRSLISSGYCFTTLDPHSARAYKKTSTSQLSYLRTWRVFLTMLIG